MMDHLTNVKISIFLRLQLEHFFRGIHAPKIRWNIRSINTNSHAIYCTLNVKLSIELKSKMKKKKNIFFLGVRFVVDVREANTNSMIHNMEHNHTVSHANTLTIISRIRIDNNKIVLLCQQHSCMPHWNCHNPFTRYQC